MSPKAKELHPARARYSSEITEPERWDSWEPHPGDIIVCTPSKSGTTWTQTMIVMLLYGTTELSDRVSALSPWIDSNLGDADHVASVPRSPSGRRVVKTHAPADGFPVWEGVDVVAVYRHPLDVMLSYRKHMNNMKEFDHPEICGPLPEALDYFLTARFADDSISNDCLEAIILHHQRTTRRPHLDAFTLLHYSDMIADHRGTVVQLSRALGIHAQDTLIDAITEKTSIQAMRADPMQFTPEGGKGFWHDEAAFFDTGGTEKWRGVFSAEEIARFEAALTGQLPDPASRNWLKNGSSATG